MGMEGTYHNRDVTLSSESMYLRTLSVIMVLLASVGGTTARTKTKSRLGVLQERDHMGRR